MAKSKGQDTMATVDQIIDAVRRIEALAGLMLAATQQADAEPLAAVVVSDTAGMIRDETGRIRTSLKGLLLTSALGKREH